MPVSDHEPHFQAREYNSVMDFDKIMPLYQHRILVKFFVPLYLFPIPFELLVGNIKFLLMTIIPTSRQEEITLLWILTKYAFFMTEFRLSFLYYFFVPPNLFPIPYYFLLL